MILLSSVNRRFRYGVQVLSIEGSQVKLEVTTDLTRSMLTSEENIQQTLNEVGCIATAAALKFTGVGGLKHRFVEVAEFVFDKHGDFRIGGDVDAAIVCQLSLARG